MKIKKIVGGGASWVYLIDKSGKILGSSHEDDTKQMDNLRKLKGEQNGRFQNKNTFYNIND